MMCLPRLLDHPSFMSSLTLWFDIKHSRAGCQGSILIVFV